MTIPTVLYIVGIILAGIELARSRGQSLLAWAVVVVCIGLLWGLIK
jgi:hypothetical protein